MYQHLSPSGSSCPLACLLSPSNCRGWVASYSCADAPQSPGPSTTPPPPQQPHLDPSPILIPRPLRAPRRPRPIRSPHPRARPPPLPHHAPPRCRPPALPGLPLLSVLVLRCQASRTRPDLLVLHRPLRPCDRPPPARCASSSRASSRARARSTLKSMRTLCSLQEFGQLVSHCARLPIGFKRL
ncbi:hypothetical protein DFH08DRAFT_1036519, partial [Mycena albidolilacea]